jgi:hypothetical protein
MINLGDDVLDWALFVSLWILSLADESSQHIQVMLAGIFVLMSDLLKVWLPWRLQDRHSDEIAFGSSVQFHCELPALDCD